MSQEKGMGLRLKEVKKRKSPLLLHRSSSEFKQFVKFLRNSHEKFLSDRLSVEDVAQGQN
jgi:hypothetical protein